MRKIPISELAWTLADYLAMEEEPPERILKDPRATEGLLMSDAEVDEYLRDSVATLLIMRDHGSGRAAEQFSMFLSDLEYLVSLGRLEEDEYNELSNPENYTF